MLEDDILDEDELDIQPHGRKALRLYKINLIFAIVAISNSILMELFKDRSLLLVIIILCMMAVIPISVMGFANIIQSNKKEEHFQKIKEAIYGHILISSGLVLAILILANYALKLL